MNNSMYWALCNSTLKCHTDIHFLQKTKAFQNNQQKLGNYVSAWNEERRKREWYWHFHLLLPWLENK